MEPIVKSSYTLIFLSLTCSVINLLNIQFFGGNPDTKFIFENIALFCIGIMLLALITFSHLPELPVKHKEEANDSIFRRYLIKFHSYYVYIVICSLIACVSS